MSEGQQTGQRNLTILIWMGLISQGCGAVFALGSMINVFNPEHTWRGIISGMMCVVFGMALSGWAGNLSEISALKKRVVVLEQPVEVEGA